MRQAIHDILHKYWGYDSFRPLQEDIIISILQGHDTLGLLPTGGGKSITFQVPAMYLDGLTIVVTPLISLMKDQVDNLRQRNIKAVYLHAGLSRSEHKLAIDRCRLGIAKLLYVSPEKLQSQNFIDTLRVMDIRLIVVDEAHCISQWGYDFRPSYLKIASLRKIFPEAPILALTASATTEVVDDIMSKLSFRQNKVFRKSFTRDNLSYIVRYNEDKENLLNKIISTTSGSTIVYVRSRRRTREISEVLQRLGHSADYYHAGLAPEDKSDKQSKWKTDQLRIIVATNAFGMGIDKPDVRVVIHYDPPTSLEEYYQEAGRAGRDGKPAFAVLLISTSDKGRLTQRISDSFPPKDFIRRVYELAGNFVEVPVGSGYNQVYEFNFNLFVKLFNLPPVATHSAMALLTQAQHFEYIEEIATQSRVMVIANKNDLYDLNLDNNTDKILRMLLRSYTGLFADYVYINEALLAARAEVSEQCVYEAMLLLSRLHIVHYIPRKSTPYIYYTTSRELPKHIDLPTTIYETQRLRLEHRINAMIEFAFTPDKCRVNIMLRYFGENPTTPCGKCDVCRTNNKQQLTQQQRKQLEDSLLYMISNAPRSIDYLINESSHNEHDVIEALRRLVKKRLADISDDTVSLH